jgi:hypothetical protein
VATINAHLAQARPWYEEHCFPIVDELYRDDEAAAKAALGQARLALVQEASLTPDEKRALEYELLLFDFFIHNSFHGDDEQAQQFEATYTGLLSHPPAGPLSESVQAVDLLSMLGMGARRGFIKMDEAGVDELVARVPPDHLTSNIWYYIAAWAYNELNLKYLELAYQRQMTETTGWVDDYYWMRTNLMYLLVAGRATRLDVEKTLLGYDHPRHIQDFERLFLGRCEEAGLMDDELRELHRRRVEELTPLQGTVPGMTPKTKRMRSK